MKIEKHIDHNLKNFLKRTVSAQIHLAGLIVFAALFSQLTYLAYTKNNSTDFYVTLLYGLSGLTLLSVSTLYHFLCDGFKGSEKLEEFMATLDYVSIYLFIAGTYSPLLLNTLPHNTQKNFMLILVWTFASLGSLYTIFRAYLPTWAQHRYVYTSLYVVMGMLFLFEINTIFKNLSSTSQEFLILGISSYIIGAIIFAIKKPNLIKNYLGFHELWHIAVLGGFYFHYRCILEFYKV